MDMRIMGRRFNRLTGVAGGVFLVIWVVFSFPFFFQGKVPAPLDFLVNFYAPWNSIYDGPVKNPAISDVVSQIIPWKIFSAQELHAGRVPLWNPFNLAGTPHLGNWQSGVLYPTTLLFLFLPITTAWSLHVLLQPLLAGVFMLLFLRSLKLSPIASLMGAVAMAYGGFMTTWMEWGTLGHALLWLPLAFYSIERSANKKQETGNPSLSSSGSRNKKQGNFWLYFSLTMSLLAGHPQTAGYVLALTFAYYVWRNWGGSAPPSLRRANQGDQGSKWNRGKVKLVALGLGGCLVVPLLLAAPQVLPGVQVYLESARTLVDGTSWAKAFLIPPGGLLTLVAPDFFGNPVTRNSWSDFSYVEMSGFAGVVTLLLVLFRVGDASRRRYRQLGRFFMGVVLAALVLMVRSPISRSVIDLEIPVISSSSPTRVMGIAGFSLAVLAALGAEGLIGKGTKGGRRGRLGLIGMVGLIGGMGLWTVVSGDANVEVARRNLIFPTGILGLFLGGVAGAFFLRRLNFGALRLDLGKLLPGFLLLVSCFDLFRFHHKYTPYGDASLWYPEVAVISELGKRQERSFGLFDANLNLPFRIKSLEGYDPLVQAELVRLSCPETKLALMNRVTASCFTKGEKETVGLITDLGVKWVVQANIHGAELWDLRLWEYPNQFELDWKGENYQILLNREAAGAEEEPVAWLRRDQQVLFRVGLILTAVTLFVLLRTKLRPGSSL